MSKPVVRYSSSTPFQPPLVVGQRACVYIVDMHPVVGWLGPGEWAHTSQVVSVSENGDFETLNTRYVKVQQA